jgi:hypothetical protein
MQAPYLSPSGEIPLPTFHAILCALKQGVNKLGKQHITCSPPVMQFEYH